jgi:hypothetical protein
MLLKRSVTFRRILLKIVLLVFILGVTLIFTMKASSLSGFELTTHRGVVSELVSEIQERIDHDPADTNLRFIPPRKEYVARFLLDTKPIEAKFQMPFTLANGDLVTLAGYAKGDGFKVLAFRNDTQQITQSNNWKMAFGAGLVFSILSLIILCGLLSSQSMIFPQILLGIFVAVGLFIAHHGLLIKEARHLLS